MTGHRSRELYRVSGRLVRSISLCIAYSYLQYGARLAAVCLDAAALL